MIVGYSQLTIVFLLAAMVIEAHMGIAIVISNTTVTIAAHMRGFLKMGEPLKNGWFIIKRYYVVLDDLGGTPFYEETPPQTNKTSGHLTVVSLLIHRVEQNDEFIPLIHMVVGQYNTL